MILNILKFYKISGTYYYNISKTYKDIIWNIILTVTNQWIYTR